MAGATKKGGSSDAPGTVLLFHGDLDRNVGVNASRLMAAALRSAGKRVQRAEHGGLRHQLADGQVRADLLRKGDAFLRASLHM